MRNIFSIRRIYCVILFFGFIVFLPASLYAQEKTKPADKNHVRLAVLPFQTVIPEDESTTVRCPICGSVNSSGNIVKGAEQIVQEIFMDKLREVKDADIIPSERVAGVYQRISADSLKQTVLQIFQRVGRELHADVLVIGYVYRYRERVGYDYSAEHPASVGFEIHMISVKNGSTLWRGIFDKTQKSLMEDVFQASSFFKGGAKWLTARQLAKLGIDEVFSTFTGFEQ